MPTSNTKPQQSAATDSPLGAPAQDPYKTVRMPNVADKDNVENAPTSENEIYKTERMGNVAMPPDNPTVEQPKPAQGA